MCPLRDRSDNRILECAVEAYADWLVTDDRRHLLPLGEHKGVRTANAPRFPSALDERLGGHGD